MFSFIDIPLGSNETGTGDAKTLTPSPGNASASGGNLIMSSELHSKVDDKASAKKLVPEVTSEESVLQNSRDLEQGDKDQNMTSDEAAVTSETRDAVKVDDPERSLHGDKITRKGLLKITEKLKKNLLKGKVSPQTSSPSSRVGSRSSSSSSVEIPMDTTEVTGQADSRQREVDEGLVATSPCLETPNTEGQVSSGIPDTVPKVDGKEVCEDNIHVPKLSAPCTGNNDVADCIAVDMVNDNKQASQSDDLQCIGMETQPFLVSTEPAADDNDHICNDVLDDSSKITSAPEKSDNINSPVVGDEILQMASSLPKESEKASKEDDSTPAKVGDSVGNLEDLSDGSVDLGPHEPGDMDSVDDDLLLEDEPVMISELYNPEPEKMDTSEILESQDTEVSELPEPHDSEVSELPESQDSEVSELAIARVESQSEDVLQQEVSDQPSSSSKRTLTEDSKDAEEGPVCKKSRTETADIIEGELSFFVSFVHCSFYSACEGVNSFCSYVCEIRTNYHLRIPCRVLVICSFRAADHYIFHKFWKNVC